MKTTKDSHSKLLAAVRRGEERACSALFRMFYPALLNFTRGLVSDHQEAEEIVLTTFTKYFGRKDNFKDLINIRAFLYITARNASLDYLRKIVREKKQKDSFAYVQSVHSEETGGEINQSWLEKAEYLVLKAELLRKLEQKLSQLPARERRFFELYYLEGKKNEECARLLGIATENARKLKNRTLARLRLTIFEKGVLLFFFLRHWF